MIPEIKGTVLSVRADAAVYHRVGIYIGVGMMLSKPEG